MRSIRFPLRAKGSRDGKGGNMREYDDYIRIRLKKSDHEKIRERMKEAGVKNMSAFIRKMAIDGYIVRLDLSDVKEVVRLLRINSNNINQYAKRANETGSIYLEDIKEVQGQQEELWKLMKEILQRLSAIR